MDFNRVSLVNAAIATIREQKAANMNTVAQFNDATLAGSLWMREAQKLVQPSTQAHDTAYSFHEAMVESFFEEPRQQESTAFGTEGEMIRDMFVSPQLLWDWLKLVNASAGAQLRDSVHEIFEPYMVQAMKADSFELLTLKLPVESYDVIKSAIEKTKDHSAELLLKSVVAIEALPKTEKSLKPGLNIA